MDDIHLLAYSKSTERNCQILEKAYRKCARWAAIYGATFAPAKYDLVYLTRKPKKVNLTVTVRLGTVSIVTIHTITSGYCPNLLSQRVISCAFC